MHIVFDFFLEHAQVRAAFGERLAHVAFSEDRADEAHDIATFMLTGRRFIAAADFGEMLA